ncbi:uncharacterized protein EMH_0097470 [Eimeria mitis]|uniref:Uncharacterized protein n=1 Tax=Eimeria mitis TaxID=44415 RepID=U6KFS1_9EIME|nr:uncharacterized protein EMH_0097470 [Eimeria mitis]CDJ36850.1 hypothetical protein EMH_0097470 [Eimeria mitis]
MKLQVIRSLAKGWFKQGARQSRIIPVGTYNRRTILLLYGNLHMEHTTKCPTPLKEGDTKDQLMNTALGGFVPAMATQVSFFPSLSASMSICRQFRGIASSSVCRAHFEDDGGVALREAKAAAAAARTAEIMLVAAIQTQVPGESELGLKYPSAFPVTSAGKGCAAERAMRTAVLKALKEANLAASRAECAENSGYILWQPGVKVRRPKTGEEAISFGSAILFRARTTLRREPVTGWINGPPRSLQPARASDMITGGEST